MSLEETVRRLEARIAELEERLRRLETAPRPEAGPGAEFGPVRLPVDLQRHRTAMNRALQMLGLVPDAERPEVVAAPAQVRPAGEDRTLDALEKAREFLGKGAPAAAGEPDLEATVADVVPPPELLPAPQREERPAVPAPDMHVEEALAVDLGGERREVAERILHGAIFLAAAAAALFFGGGALLRWMGVSLTPAEKSALGAAIVAGAWAAAGGRAGPGHLRAAAAGIFGLLANAALWHFSSRLPPGSFPPACVATEALVLALALRTRHPLALFVGLVAPLLLFAVWPGRAAQEWVQIGALFAAAGAAAVAMRRLQAPLLGILLLAVWLARGGWHPGLETAAGALFVSAALVAAALAAGRYGRLHAGALALAALALFACACHLLLDAPRLLRAAALLAGATAAATAGARIGRGGEILRGALKAGAALLVLSILPVGFSGGGLAFAALAASFLLGLFAAFFRDDLLRAGGILLLVLGVAVALYVGASPVLCAASAATAGALLFMRGNHPDPRALRLLLAGVAFLAALGLFPAVLAAERAHLAWMAGGILLSLAGKGSGSEILLGGGALWAGAACVAGAASGEPVHLGAAGAGVVVLAFLHRGSGSGRLFGLLAILLLAAAAEVFLARTAALDRATRLGLVTVGAVAGALFVWRRGLPRGRQEAPPPPPADAA